MTEDIQNTEKEQEDAVNNTLETTQNDVLTTSNLENDKQFSTSEDEMNHGEPKPVQIQPARMLVENVNPANGADGQPAQKDERKDGQSNKPDDATRVPDAQRKIKSETTWEKLKSKEMSDTSEFEQKSETMKKVIRSSISEKMEVHKQKIHVAPQGDSVNTIQPRISRPNIDLIQNLASSQGLLDDVSGQAYSGSGSRTPPTESVVEQVVSAPSQRGHTVRVVSEVRSPSMNPKESGTPVNVERPSEETMHRRLIELESALKDSQNLSEMHFKDVRESQLKIKFLSQKSADLEKSNQILRDELEHMQRKNHSIEWECTKLRQERDQLYQQLHESETRRREHEHKLQKVKEEYHTLKREVNVFRRDNDLKAENLHKAATERSALLRQIAQLESELQKYDSPSITPRQVSTLTRKIERSKPPYDAASDMRWASGYNVATDHYYSLRQAAVVDNPQMERSHSVMEKLHQSVPVDVGWKSDVLRTERRHEGIYENKIEVESSTEKKNVQPLTPGNVVTSVNFTPIAKMSPTAKRDTTLDGPGVKTDVPSTFVKTDEQVTISPDISPTLTRHENSPRRSAYLRPYPDFHEDSMQSSDQGKYGARDFDVSVGQSPIKLRPKPTEQKRYKRNRSLTTSKKKSYRKAHEPLFNTGIDKQTVRTHRYRPASETGFYDDIYGGRRYDTYPAGITVRPSTSIGHLPITEHVRTLDRDLYRPLQIQPPRSPYVSIRTVRTPLNFMNPYTVPRDLQSYLHELENKQSRIEEQLARIEHTRPTEDDERRVLQDCVEQINRNVERLRKIAK